MRYTCTTVFTKTKENISTYIDEAIYGANDGIITTFAVISAGAGASLSNDAIIIIGAANLIADGFSMGASSFLSIRTEEDVQRLKSFFKFFKRKKSDAIPRSGVTFGAFVIAGIMPLLPFLTPYTAGNEFLISALSAGVAFFFVGGIRTYVTKRGFFISGAEMLLVGGIAAILAYSIGAIVEAIV